MRLDQINIRDPFVLNDNGTFYLYGTRAENFGQKTGGFDVYTSADLLEWSNPSECFNSVKNGMNTQVNWAPEVHRYKDKYYMLATFTGNNGLRGTYILKSDSPSGPFEKHSDSCVTPPGWECLDGTLYVDKNAVPYLVFCHEHTQIIDGTVCYIKLSEDLSRADGEPHLLFSGSSPEWADEKEPQKHFITDGPFMYRTKNGALLMIWSTFIKGVYAQCAARSDNGEIDGKFIHLPPLFKDDGGHGMIFSDGKRLILTFHTPNTTGSEHPVFKLLKDNGDGIEITE